MNHIRCLFEEGMPISKIACATHHTFNTIKKYLNPEYSPVNGHYDLQCVHIKFFTKKMKSDIMKIWNLQKDNIKK